MSQETKFCPKDGTEMSYRICFGDSHWICPKCGEMAVSGFFDSPRVPFDIKALSYYAEERKK